MGALHAGHVSLFTQAKKENDMVVASIFINPTQFLPHEDLDKYPNTLQSDLEKCEKEGVDIVFAPHKNTIYGKDEVLIKAPNIRSYALEGERRPEHFDGVLQIVLKLFNIVKPTNAYFGKKDAQQLSMISQMVKDLFLDINIKACEIIREEDGLAMSSRNVYLSAEQRAESLNISRSLFHAKELIDAGELDIKNIKNSMNEILKNLDVEYLEFVNKEFEKIEKIEKNNTIILIVAKLGTTRLLDNLWM